MTTSDPRGAAPAAPGVDRVHGVDVGGGDRGIDWPALRAAGVRFVYVKLTEGVTFHDPDAAANADGARAAGILVGCYHFYRPLADARQQAEVFARRIREIGGDQLEPVSDFEWCGRTDDWATLPTWKRRAGIDVHLRRLRELTGRDPGAYVGPGFTADRLGADFPMGGSPWLWVADAREASIARGTPELPRPWSSWRIWQPGSRPAVGPGAGLDADVSQLPIAELTASCRPVA